MKNKYQLTAQIETLYSVRDLAEAYEEISVMKMQRVRSKVLTTREFLSTLSEVFVDVKSSYKHQIQKYIDRQEGKGFHFFWKKKNVTNAYDKNGKTLSVFISSNAKLYGDIIYKIFDRFAMSIENENNDILIVGKLGKELFDNRGTQRPYQYFDLPDTNVTLEQIKPLIAYVLPYKEVKVYYGKFANVVNQIAEEANVTGDEPLSHIKPLVESDEQILEGTPTDKDVKKVLFGFEPSLEHVLGVFESQVISSLFKQTVNESELSRYASRITAMEEALMNISEQEKRLESEIRSYRRAVENKKQLNTLSGITLWGK